jgi:hypothetical protein
MKIPATHFSYRLSRPQSHTAAGSIRSVEGCSDLIENLTCSLPARSIVSQPTTLPPAPSNYIPKDNIVTYKIIYFPAVNDLYLLARYLFFRNF